VWRRRHQDDERSEAGVAESRVRSGERLHRARWGRSLLRPCSRWCQVRSDSPLANAGDSTSATKVSRCAGSAPFSSRDSVSRSDWWRAEPPLRLPGMPFPSISTRTSGSTRGRASKRRRERSPKPSRGVSSFAPDVRPARRDAHPKAHGCVRATCFEFLVQPRTTPSMSVEPSMIEWNEIESPFRKVATLTIPRQAFDLPAQDEPVPA
jgi:hypothetical protein